MPSSSRTGLYEPNACLAAAVICEAYFGYCWAIVSAPSNDLVSSLWVDCETRLASELERVEGDPAGAVGSPEVDDRLRSLGYLE